MGSMLMSAFIVLAVIGAPIAVVLGFSSFISLSLGTTMPLTLIPQQMFAACDSFPLLAIPLFMIAGSLMEAGGISNRLIHLADVMVGHLTGGLAHVAIVTCMFFAAISGSGPATVAAIGAIMIPAMVKAGYDLGFASSVMAVAGAIGVIIPPSIPMVTYATMSNVSIAGIFTAGFGPGLLVGFALMLCSYIVCRKNGYGISQTRERATLSERWKAFKDAFWALLMPVIILGGIYAGIFTPTEAAAVAVFYGAAVGLFVYRELDLKMLKPVLINSGKTTAMIMFIIATARVFGWIMTAERIPDKVAEAMMTITESRVLILILINVMLLIVGCFMETNAALIILAPIFLPVVQALGISPIHFGIIMIVNLAIGMSTPPLGVNLFVACGIGKLSIERISRAVVPLLVANIIALLAITYIEPISMALVKLVTP